MELREDTRRQLLAEFDRIFDELKAMPPKGPERKTAARIINRCLERIRSLAQAELAWWEGAEHGQGRVDHAASEAGGESPHDGVPEVRPER